MPASFWFMVAVVGTAILAFISVVAWLGARTKEREAHYRSETVKKVAESGNAQAVLELVKETERVETERNRTKARLAGLIIGAVGVGLMVFLHEIAVGSAVYLVGLMPVLVGMVLLFASEVMIKARE